MNIAILTSNNQWFVPFAQALKDKIKNSQLFYEHQKIDNSYDIVFILSYHKIIAQEFWVCAPGHLSYFNKEGLEALAKEAGWQLKKTISDYPIDLDLLSVNSNYVNNKALGKVSHTKRIEFENLIHSISVEKTNQFYESLADLGLGRNIVSFFTLT